jgi:hypothetical protein
MNIVQSLFTIVVQQLITEQAKFLFSALCLTILSEFSAVGKQQASDRERTYNQLIADIVQWGRGVFCPREGRRGREDKRCTLLSEWGPVVLHGSDARPNLSACFLFNLWAVGGEEGISWLQISLREGQTQQQLLSFPSYLYSGHNRFPVMGSLCRTVLPAPTWYRGKQLT